jgi:hypothetical protein
MGSRVTECKGTYSVWKEQASAALPVQLKTEHTEQANRLPGFEPMARCIAERGVELGIDPKALLDKVEREGGRVLAAAEWSTAVGEVAPLRRKLQEAFLKRGERMSLLQRAVARGKADEVGLAPSAAQMDMAEVKVCQVYIYGLASRLRGCAPLTAAFADAAGMTDRNAPLRNYDGARWDPTTPKWAELEACAHVHAAAAGTEVDVAWRRGADSGVRAPQKRRPPRR